jgi:uncharacterized protein with GYD domain
MARYLYQAAYTSASWKTQISDPRDARQRVEPLAVELGGRLEEIYYSFGAFDVVAILEFPDDEAMAAFALAVAAGGAIAKAETTKLLELTAGQAAMRKAAAAAPKYQVPLREYART